jgi:hypothetical protein
LSNTKDITNFKATNCLNVSTSAIAQHRLDADDRPEPHWRLNPCFKTIANLAPTNLLLAQAHQSNDELTQGEVALLQVAAA